VPQITFIILVCAHLGIPRIR